MGKAIKATKKWTCWNKQINTDTKSVAIWHMKQTHEELNLNSHLSDTIRQRKQSNLLAFWKFKYIRIISVLDYYIL